MVQNAITKLGPFFWCFLCNKHSNSDINQIKRIEILKILQNEWPYWKIHPNPIFKPNTNNAPPHHDDKMMQVMDIISSDNLLLEPLPTQKMINRYENIIYSMHNMPLSLSTNIGPIGLLQKHIKDKYDKNTKYQTNLHKTTQSLHWNELQNTLNYNINASNASYDLTDDEKKEQGQLKQEELKEEEHENKNGISDIISIPLSDKLKRNDIELSRNEVINLLWNSKEKFFNSITCDDYLRMSPYDLRYDPCFSIPIIGKPFFNKNNSKIIKGMTGLHFYNYDDVTDANLSLNENMGLPEPINYTYIPLIKHRLGLNQSNNENKQININFNDIIDENGLNTSNKWDGEYESYLTNNDIMGWRWVLNRWAPPQHLSSVSCICLQCKESIDIYNKKYIQAINQYKQMKKLIPNYRQTEHKNNNNTNNTNNNKQTQHIEQLQKIFNKKEKNNNENKSDNDDQTMDIDNENDNENDDGIVNEDNEPKILQFQEEPLTRIPVIIKSKYGKVLANFSVPSPSENNTNNNNELYNKIDIDFGPNPPPIYNKMNDILESKNTPKPKIKSSLLHGLTMKTTSSADDTSQSALNALYNIQMSNNNNKRTYSQMNNNNNTNNNPPLKKRKLTNDKHENSDNENDNDISISDSYFVSLDSYRNLENSDILLSESNKNKKDSLCKHLSDTVYELYERIRSNDSIKHMIRTNLANKIKTKSMIQYEKLHEIVVKHAIEHSCIWLRIRTSLARGYSDTSGTYSIPIPRDNNNDNENETQDEDYSVCTVCFDGSFSDDNPIVFCDECNVGIHRYCYGIVTVPYEDDTWYCDSCNWIKLQKNTNNINKIVISKPQCCLCPINGCALKQTKSGGFAHVACALWLKGIDIGNLKRMNPICGVLKVQNAQTKSAIKLHSKMLEIGLKINNQINIENDEKTFLGKIGEWTHKCIVCDDDNGCFIECGHEECISRIHVLCGWFAGYFMRINMNDSTGSISCVIYCPKHTPLEHGGTERNLNYYKQIRGNGTTERKNMILMEKKRNKYQKLTAKLIRFPDKYPNNICCICFTDYKEFKLIKCIKCGINIHDKCYCIDNITNINEWKCDICVKFPEYYKTLLCIKSNNKMEKEESDSDDLDVQRVFNLECIECIFCPRRGGAFKQIEYNNEIKWIHVCCGQWINGIRFNKKLNKFIVGNNNKIKGYKNENNNNNSMCYLCNKKQINGIDIIIKCEYNLCNKPFHVICGLFGDCYLKAHKSENNKFEFKFYCKMHKYFNNQNQLKNGIKNEKNINLSKLGQHLLNIKRLRLKLDKIKLTGDRISEYELNQRGMINNTTKSYKECGTYNINKSTKNKDRTSSKKQRKNSNKKTNKNSKKHIHISTEYKDKESDYEYDIKTKRTTRRSTRKKSSSKKYKNKRKRDRKRRHSKHNDEYNISEYSDDMVISENEYDSEYEYNKHMEIEQQKFDTRATRHHSKSKRRKSKINKKETHIAPDGIRMATDIWAEQYHYEGGEIKWPVVKRNGWFMAIPRLKLPKGNKYRYSHLERKQKQELLEKEKEREEKGKKGNNEWNNFLSLIKEKEQEMDNDDNDNTNTNKTNNNNTNNNNNVKSSMDEDENEDENDNIRNAFQKYAAGGPGWELTNDLHQPKNTDSNDNNKVCPYCKKVKKSSISVHNWQRHLNAKHVFKCKKCRLYFTRHQLLTKHLEECNGNE